MTNEQEHPQDPQSEEELRLEIFEHDFTIGLAELLDNAEILLDTPMAPDPASMGFDERTLEELSPEELDIIQKVLFRDLGLNVGELDQQKVREYVAKAAENARVPGEINVSVFRTNIEEDGIFLQELVYEDAQKRWVIGPDQDI